MDELLDEERKASLEQTGRDPPHGETRAGIHRHMNQQDSGIDQESMLRQRMGRRRAESA